MNVYQTIAAALKQPYDSAEHAIMHSLNEALSVAASEAQARPLFDEECSPDSSGPTVPVFEGV